MATIDRALQIAARAHEGQKDRSGQPYILHPLRVMMKQDSEDARIVGILHDVLEDTSVTADDLRQAGFRESVIEAVLCVTHEKHEPYSDYVIRCKANPIARQVKLADLEDNSRPERALVRPQRIDTDVARLGKYLLAYKYLTEQLSEAQYRLLMEEQS